jgi:hypothetical protein
MVWIVILALGFVIGLVIGRWWTPVIAAAFGAWIWRTTGVEIAHWFLGLLAGGFAALGIGAGVAARRLLKSSR